MSTAGTAVVVGGGFAGVLAAEVLADHADEVIVVEAGRYPADPGARPGLPQAHHNHLLVTAGARALEELLPGIVEALLERGVRRRGLPDGALILSAHGWFHRHDTGADLLSGSRWLLDHVVRQRARVPVRQSTRVLGLAGDRDRITGIVVTRGTGRAETIPAGLVVDATGRRSRMPRWLAARGGPAVDEETVDPGLAYSTRIYQAPAGFADRLPAIMLHPRGGHGATLFPIEDDRWIVTLTGTRGHEPPVSEQGFTEAAYALASPIIAELMAGAKPLGAVRPYRATGNRRRYFERGPRVPGLLVLGDALAAMNPVYSHGMTVAALSARRLGRELARGGIDSAGLQSAMAAEVDRPWRMATAQDRAQAGPDAGDRGMRGLLGRAQLGDPALLSAIFRAQTLIGDEAAVDAALRRLPAGRLPPPLSTDQAIAQYPGLAAWWQSGPTGSES